MNEQRLRGDLVFLLGLVSRSQMVLTSYLTPGEALAADLAIKGLLEVLDNEDNVRRQRKIEAAIGEGTMQAIDGLLASEPVCEWTYDDVHGHYETGCENAFILTEGTPEDNGLKFCPYCGKPLMQNDEDAKSVQISPKDGTRRHGNRG